MNAPSINCEIMLKDQFGKWQPYKVTLQQMAYPYPMPFPRPPGSTSENSLTSASVVEVGSNSNLTEILERSRDEEVIETVEFEADQGEMIDGQHDENADRMEGVEQDDQDGDVKNGILQQMNAAQSGRAMSQNRRKIQETRKRKMRRKSETSEPILKSKKMDENWSGVATERFTWFKGQTKRPENAKQLNQEATRVGIKPIEIQHAVLPFNNPAKNYHFYNFATNNKEEAAMLKNLIPADFVDKFCVDKFLGDEDNTFFFLNVGFKEAMILAL